MSDKSAVVRGEFVTFSHIKGRKTFAITIEFPEEMTLHVLNTLGTPVAEKSLPVAVALMHKKPETGIPVAEKSQPQSQKQDATLEKSEGENMRIRAVMLCKEKDFQEYVTAIGYNKNEQGAKDFVLDCCIIESRTELVTNVKAQEEFEELYQKFKSWQFENTHADNIGRM